MDYKRFKNEVERLYNERRQLHNNDSRVYEQWEKIADFMASNEEQTIKLLDECDSEAALWYSEVFDDISERIKSENFIKALEKLDIKFPDLKLTKLINDAKNYL
jgi:hypothetical protein